jgi:extracellular factor (EF) 3-hydroxypalmitic acid methyl ester biosynthesis protein
MQKKPDIRHEDISVEHPTLQRKLLVRQDRIDVAEEGFQVSISGKQLELSNLSAFGFAAIVRSADVAQMLESTNGTDTLTASIVSENTVVQSVAVRRVRSGPHPQSVFGDHLFAFEVTGESINVDRINAWIASRKLLAAQSKSFEMFSEVPQPFKARVYDMQDWLLQLRHRINELESNCPTDQSLASREIRETAIAVFSELVGEVLPKKYSYFPMELTSASPETKRLAAEFVKEKIGPLVYGAPFANRAFSKPLGYAGDYEMMNQLYRSLPSGKSLYDQCLHKYFIEEPAGQAVKNRATFLLEKLRHTIAQSNSPEVRILAVASGPAMELQLLLKSMNATKGKRIKIYCLDQDESSLKHAQSQLLAIKRLNGCNVEFEFLQLAIKNIISRGLSEEPFDLIYSAGLFDYLTNPVARMACQKLWESVNDRGRLIIGNFSRKNPCVPFMETVLEWHLIYRDHHELKQLFSGISPKLQIEDEALGINSFAILER